MNYIKLANNQRLVKIDKAISNRENTYAIFNLKALVEAMECLRPSAFKLWCYFNANQQGYEFAFSSKDFREKAKGKERENKIMSTQAYRDAWNELVEKKYLEYLDEIRPGISGYVFHEAAARDN